MFNDFIMSWFCTCFALAQMEHELAVIRNARGPVIIQQPVAVAQQPVVVAQQPQAQPQPTAVVEPQKDHTD